MSRLPIKALKAMGNTYDQDILIVFGVDRDGETTHIATWGRTLDDCSRAADWGNKIKEKLGWPKSLFAQPSRVRTLQARVKELEAQLLTTNESKESEV